MIENIAEAFEAVEDEHREFGRIGNPLSKRRDLCAFLYVDKIFPSDSEVLAHASHDQVTLQLNSEDFAAKATEADVLYLTRCGVVYEDEEDYFFLFV